MTETYATLIGIAIQTALYLLAGYGLVVRNDVATRTLKEDIHQMQQELNKLATVITTQAVQNNKIDNITERQNMQEKRLDELSRGIGWKTARPSLEGEYP